MIDSLIPTTTKGVLVGVFVAVIAVTVLFSAGIGPVLLVAAIVGGILYIAYALGVRVHNRIIRGKRSGGSGGDA